MKILNVVLSRDLSINNIVVFLNSYSKTLNKMYDRRGSLFNHKFKRKKIKSGEYLRQVKAYIHLNPVHHEFVPKLYDQKYFISFFFSSKQA